MGDVIETNTGKYAEYFPVCCTANVSAEFKDRFLKADQDEWGDVVDSLIFVDSVDVLYTEGHLLGHNTPTSPNSPFLGKTAQECHVLLKRLAQETSSPLSLQIYAILDERSLRDDTVVLVEVEELEVLTVRVDFTLAVSRMFQYSIGDMTIDEDIEEAAETADGVFRLSDGACEGCKWCSGDVCGSKL